jgi:uncharacterized membrane protein
MNNRLLPLAFLAIGAVCGSAYALLVPPHEVPDENVHFVRAYGVSLGSCIAREITPVPSSMLSLGSGSHPFSLATVSGTTTNVANSRADIYFCGPYLAPAVALAAARGLHLSPLHTFYLGRFANLAFYLALVCLALRLLPDFQLSLLCLALMPMTLHQAASYSADALTISSAFLLTAYCLHLSFHAQALLRPAQLVILALLMAVSSLCKFNLWFALLILLIPAQRFGRPSRRWIALAAGVALCCLSAASWQWINRRNTELFEQARLRVQNVDVRVNAAYIAHHPAPFLGKIVRTSIRDGANYFRMFVGVLGSLQVSPPDYMFKGYALLLALSIFIASGRARLQIPQRALLLLISAASLLSVFSVLWVLETKPPLDSQMFVSGVQGRYFIPFAFLIQAALSIPRLRPAPVTIIGIALAITALNLVALQAVHRAYEKPSSHLSDLGQRERNSTASASSAIGF